MPYIFEANGNYFLLLRINYFGHDFLGWDSLVFAVDDDRYDKEVDYFDVERDFDENFDSAECYTEDYLTNGEIDILRQIVNSDETIVRFYGNDYNKKYDFTVPETDNKAIKEVLDAYDVIENYQ